MQDETFEHVKETLNNEDSIAPTGKKTNCFSLEKWKNATTGYSLFFETVICSTDDDLKAICNFELNSLHTSVEVDRNQETNFLYYQ